MAFFLIFKLFLPSTIKISKFLKNKRKENYFSLIVIISNQLISILISNRVNIDQYNPQNTSSVRSSVTCRGES